MAKKRKASMIDYPKNFEGNCHFSTPPCICGTVSGQMCREHICAKSFSDHLHWLPGDDGNKRYGPCKFLGKNLDVFPASPFIGVLGKRCWFLVTGGKGWRNVRHENLCKLPLRPEFKLGFFELLNNHVREWGLSLCDQNPWFCTSFLCDRELLMEMLLLQTTNPQDQLTTRKISESEKIHQKRKTNYDNGKPTIWRCISY